MAFDSIFKYLEDNNLSNRHQFGFRPGDSCVYELLSITYHSTRVFDADPLLEVKDIVIDMS